MTHQQWRWRAGVCVGLCVTAIACGEDALRPDHDAATSNDAGFDAHVQDAAIDAMSDAGIDAGTDAGSDAGVRVTVLDDVTLDDGRHYQLLRLQHDGLAPTYAQWFPPASGTRRPAVAITKPYDGIDWTEEDVDARWAALGSGFHPDVDGPNAGNDPGGISYTLSPHETTDDGSLFRLHDMGALLIYGRYYAGGSVQNDIDDMVTGLDFLGTTALVDTDRIGIWGGSWGGFEALYGAAYAHDLVKPSVGAGLSPLSDFEREVEFVMSDLPVLYTTQPSREAASTFFAPYLRRIEPTRQARGGYEGLRAQDLAQRIDAPFLLIHDDWDTLVSFDQSTTLVSLAPTVFQPLWFLHDAPPDPWDSVVNDHGPLLAQHSNAAITFLTAFLLTRLADPAQPIYTFWDTDNMRALSTLIHDQQQAGLDVDFYAARLRELADPRVTLVRWGGTEMWSGAQHVADEVNTVWGTTFTADTIRTGLEAGLP